MMNREILKNWRHVMKLDPAKPLTDTQIDHILRSGTDALMIGGTDGVTYENTNNLLSRLALGEIPLIQEISTLESVHPSFDAYLIPSVLNTSDIRWVYGEHLEAIKKFGEYIPWEKLWWEGYVVGNPEAKVAKKTNSDCSLTPADVTAYARLTEHVFQFPVFYVEYSGTYGGTQWLQAASRSLNRTLLFYGGGISEEAQAKEVAAYADVVVVGNVIYEDLDRACESVQWVKETKKQ